ncbi:MAG: prephenate dehydrogenase/arogenate dehydrogenase family protein [Hydrogenophilaceae bacterium]|nr:prephenate dehydrogenase/arogenate dehydrogenase family protein [Hydrogenophilaceae bacterium]
MERLVIVGVGLIGGSFALALRQVGQVRHIVGVGRSQANLRAALQQGVIDEVADSAATAVRGADLVLLAVPVGAMPALLREIAPHLPADCIVTDVGSTKQDVVAAAKAGLADQFKQFVPGHPIAGAENSGVAAARGDLYQGRQVVLTPLAENNAAAVERIAALWRACGAEVAQMSAETHDRIFAAVSHLPHLAAFALVDDLAGRTDADTYFRYAGSGFRDFTRIAGSHPEMWRDIALANREALLTELEAYIAELELIRGLLARGDAAGLEAVFQRASRTRKDWNPNT